MEEVLKLSVAKLRLFADPFEHNPWDYASKLTIELVTKCLYYKTYKQEAYPLLQFEDGEAWTLEDHAKRIAYLVVFGWNDAIEVDVGIPDLGYSPQWPVMDGNHRLAAAIYMDLDVIEAEVSGDCEILSKLLASP